MGVIYAGVEYVEELTGVMDTEGEEGRA
eukprot:IDg5705t1